MPIAASQPLTRCEGVLTAPVDDEIVLLTPSLKHYVALSPAGRRIWDLLATPHTPAALAARLATEFAASEAEILSDILPFLEELRRDGLVLPGAAPA
jgi:hypothetical protein